MLRFAVPPEQLIFLYVLTPALVAAVLAAVLLKRRASARSAFAEPDLFERIAQGHSHARVRTKLVLAVAAVVMLGAAAGRPQVGTRLGVAKRQGVDLMIALDVSDSMRARDLRPDRLEKARREALALIDLLDGDRVGIVIFSGEAFVQCPLTLDYGAATMLLSTIEPGVIPRPGTALAEAIRQAARSMESAPDRSKVLVIMTDGEDHGSDPVEAARAAAESGIRIYTIGLGSTAGEPIPDGTGDGYKRDRDGQIVMSKLDEATLMDVADATGGRYFRATDSERELAAISDEISGLQQGELESRMMAYYEERFQIPLAAALLMLLLDSFMPERRRRREA